MKLRRLLPLLISLIVVAGLAAVGVYAMRAWTDNQVISGAPENAAGAQSIARPQVSDQVSSGQSGEDDSGTQSEHTAHIPAQQNVTGELSDSLSSHVGSGGYRPPPTEKEWDNWRKKAQETARRYLRARFSYTNHHTPEDVFHGLYPNSTLEHGRYLINMRDEIMQGLADKPWELVSVDFTQGEFQGPSWRGHATATLKEKDGLGVATIGGNITVTLTATGEYQGWLVDGWDFDQ